MNRLIGPLRRLVNRVGFDIVRREKTLPADLTAEEWSHPLELINKYKGRDIILSVPVRDIYFQGERGSKKSQSFYIRTIVEYFSGKRTTYEDSYLQRYYESFQPKNAAEFFGITVENDSKLLQVSAWAATLPWESIAPEEKIKRRIENQVKEAKDLGLNLDYADGHNQFGPVSARKGEMEFSRLVLTAKSIARYGYQKKYGYPTANLLIDNKNYVFNIRAGHHRVAAMCALDYDEIHLFLPATNIKRFSEYFAWPGFLSEIFTLENIKEMKNKYFILGRSS